MMDEVYKDFFTDHQTRRVLESSEVWRNYSKSELARDEIRQKRATDEKLDTENKLMAQIEEFRQKVASNPELKAYFKKVKATLEAHPELTAKVDPNFISGIELLDLED
jgi:uncharacterized membrane-anchored protein YjiN (DUF445 family)